MSTAPPVETQSGHDWLVAGTISPPSPDVESPLEPNKAWQDWSKALTALLRKFQERSANFLRGDRQEAIFTLWLERHLGKEEILSRYLNTAYFGAGVYGVDAAAKRYFGKTAKDLSLSEAAMLAALVRAPSALAPTRILGGARHRAGLV